MTRTGVFRQLSLVQGSGVLGPLLTAACALLLLVFLRSGNVSYLVISEEGFGPYSWPKVMLIGIAASAFALALLRWRAFARGKVDAVGRSLGEDSVASGSRSRDIIAAVIALLAYGMAQVYIGFALATFLFLVTWMVLASRRGLATVIVSSAACTVGLLYLFVKVAYLPLPKGELLFDDFTVKLYQLLHIY